MTRRLAAILAAIRARFVRKAIPTDLCVCGDERQHHAPGGGECLLNYGHDMNQPPCAAFRRAGSQPRRKPSP